MVISLALCELLTNLWSWELLIQRRPYIENYTVAWVLALVVLCADVVFTITGIDDIWNLFQDDAQV
jgi:hypothetical protein